MLACSTLLWTCSPTPATRRPAPMPLVEAPAPEIVTPSLRRTRTLATLLRLTEKPRLSATDLQVTFAADRLTTEEGVATLLSGLDANDDSVREDSRTLIWQLPPEFHPELVRLCPARHRSLVAQILAAQGRRAVVWLNDLLNWHASAEDAGTRLSVFTALGAIAPEHPEVISAITRGLTDSDAQIRLFAVTYLIDSPDARPLVETTLKVLRLSKDRTIADTARFWQDFLKNSRVARLGK
ncbi:hypothetical protein KKD52_15655 [Myxococcota bacterium]|nr:hypothetical protein [Myxococcota bacterium]MBU1411350.1 hypothetical protein [Myxococcota bacterium]MBU1511788.1 hypothetical protein [Myxococcota bacterium]